MELTLTAQQLEPLYKLIGREVYLEDVMRVVTFLVRDLHPARVGALQVCCSDESEKECSDIFQQRLADHFLPQLKFATASPFRTINLGGRYEWGSVRLTESHFADPDPKAPPTLILTKLNSHVSVATGPDGVVYGRRTRYGSHEDSFCGFLHALLDGTRLAASPEIEELFRSEGKDRLATLLDPEQVDPCVRSVFAALVNARLQARKCVLDVQDLPGPAPVVHLVLPAVTFNRTGRDTEMVCGIYTVDRRIQPAAVHYCGLSADAATYRGTSRGGRLSVDAKESRSPRRGRDHRERLSLKGPVLEALKTHTHLDEIRYKSWLNNTGLEPYSGVLLKALVAALLELSPVPAVLLLFGEGLIDIHQIFRIQRLSDQDNPELEARAILGDFGHGVDSLSPQRVGRAIEVLREAYDLRLDTMNKPSAELVSTGMDAAHGDPPDAPASDADGATSE